MSCCHGNRWVCSELWLTSLENVDLKTDKTMIIHKVLAYETMGDIYWLIDESGYVKILY